MPIIVKSDNGIVTDTYLDIIGEALHLCGLSVKYTDSIRDVFQESKEEIVVVARTIQAYQLMVNGYRNIVFWSQGVEPEESYMKHKSKIRFWILSHMEKQILKKAFFVFFVSDEMRRHYTQKYGIHFDTSKYYCMPCMNTEIHPEAFQCSEKYQKNIFAYVGSLAPWQRFEETVRVYRTLESAGVTDCMLKVFTAQKEEAEKIIKGNGIQHYSIEFVNNQELPKVLSNVKYGFILREDTTVNRVATPTKLSTYLSCGMIPIYSECLVDFAEQAKDMKYVVIHNDEMLNSIENLKCICKDEILSEYTRKFDTYYSREYHISNAAEKLRALLR